MRGQRSAHSQQPQAALDWHLLQQSMVVRVLTMGPMLLPPPMMTFSRKDDVLQQLGAGATAATEEESSCRARWRCSVLPTCSPISRVDAVSPGQQHATTSSRPAEGLRWSIEHERDGGRRGVKIRLRCGASLRN